MKLVKCLFFICMSLIILSCKAKEDTFFSVIIPTYNREELISKAIDSVLSQNYNNYEIIVIDDGSIDNTVELMNKYLDKDKRIRFFINDKNMGVSYSRNRGIDEAKGEFVTFLDSDDILLKGFFREMNKNIVENKDTVFFMVWTKKMHDNLKELKPFHKPENFLELAYMNTTSTTGTTVKRSYLLDNNLRFDENWRTAEDYKLWSDIFVSNAKMKIIKKVLASIKFGGKRWRNDSDYRLSMNYRDVEIRKKVREYLSKDKQDYCSIFKLLIEKEDKRFSMEDLEEKKETSCYIEDVKLKEKCEKTSKCFVLYHPYITRPMMLDTRGMFCSNGQPSCGSITSRTKNEINFEWENGFKETFYKLDYFPNSYYAD